MKLTSDRLDFSPNTFSPNTFSLDARNHCGRAVSNLAVLRDVLASTSRFVVGSVERQRGQGPSVSFAEGQTAAIRIACSPRLELGLELGPEQRAVVADKNVAGAVLERAPIELSYIER